MSDSVELVILSGAVEVGNGPAGVVGLVARQDRVDQRGGTEVDNSAALALGDIRRDRRVGDDERIVGDTDGSSVQSIKTVPDDEAVEVCRDCGRQTAVDVEHAAGVAALDGDVGGIVVVEVAVDGDVVGGDRARPG